MQVTFISNYINHHQIPLSNAFYELLDGNYYFIQTQPMEEERMKMGWGAEVGSLPYVVKAYENKEKCDDLLNNSDILICGGDYDRLFIKERVRSGKLTFRYFERIYKDGQWKMISPRGLLAKYRMHTCYRKSDVYLLCAGGYVADDFHLIKAYPNKMLKWGYFPQNYAYNLDEIFQKKQEKEVPILLWTGRMIDWKHPELAVMLAKKLKEEGYKFQLHMVGNGEMQETLHQSVKNEQLEDVVQFFDFMPPTKIREKMVEADIYLMTSDRKEGWGAVVNEAMNSGCAVISSHMVGAIPFLIEHEKNGLVFYSENIDSLYDEAKKILEDTEYGQYLGVNAYHTIDMQWNALVAAKRFLQFCKDKNMNTYQEGPCSKAQPIREYKMFKRLTKKQKEEK